MPMALGLIESIGLTAAVEAADAAVKAASIEAYRYGKHQRKRQNSSQVSGRCRSRKSSRGSGRQSRRRSRGGMLLQSYSTACRRNQKAFLKNESLSYEQKETNGNREETQITCNLCMDPKCGRKRGEPHVNCIHYSDEKINDQKDMKGEHHE